MIHIRSFLASLLLTLASDLGDAVVIQALVDLDNDSEDLVKTLINKVDALIDPKVIDSRNATQELAFALLRLGPMITVSGNITDGGVGFSFDFTFNAKAGVNAIANVNKSLITMEDKADTEEIIRVQSGLLKPIVAFFEPYLLGSATILLNGIVANIIAHLMNEMALLSSTNFC